jgi:hypothetical protein
MKYKLPALLLTLFLILTLVPVAFAEDIVEVETPAPAGKEANFFCAYLADTTEPEVPPDPEDPVDSEAPLDVAEEEDPLETPEAVIPQHPVAAGIVSTYGEPTGVDYDQVMTWFCVDGYGFGEIMLALETSKFLSNSEDWDGEFLDPADLLLQKTESGSWGAVWSTVREALDITGRPKSDEWTGGWPDRKGDGPDDNSGGVGPSNTDSPKKQGPPNSEDPVSDDPADEALTTSSTKPAGHKGKAGKP